MSLTETGLQFHPPAEPPLAELPPEMQSALERIGRAARANRRAYAIQMQHRRKLAAETAQATQAPKPARIKTARKISRRIYNPSDRD